MGQTYKFVTSFPASSSLPRDRMQVGIYLEHVAGIAFQTDLDSVADDLIGIWKYHTAETTREIKVDVYKQGSGPTGPPETTRISTGSSWPVQCPREVSLCLSMAADPTKKRQRGRIYMPVCLWGGFSFSERPTSSLMNKVLDYYRVSNHSFPDLGGIDWKHGIWSRADQAFHQAEVAWVDDEWDTQRRRGLRPTTRVQSVREG